MKIDITKTAAYVLLVAASFASCSKALDLAPYDTIDPSKAFRNMNDIDLGIIGAYAVLDYTLIANVSAVSDEALIPTENTFTNNDAFRWQYSSSSGSVTAAFSEYYVTIDRVNRVLENIDKVASTDETLKNRYRAELLALRAYSHFELLRGYASGYAADSLGVTYMVKSEIALPSRISFGATIAKVKEDLAAAKALMPVSFSDRIRITKPAIVAIQARVALYEKNWTEAVTYSTEAIAALPLATKTQFPNIWTDKTEAEVFWKLKRVIGDSRLGSVYYRELEKAALYAPSFKMVNLYDKLADVRYASYIKDNPSSISPKTPYVVAKYIGGNTTAPGLADIKLLRTGEMYLIRAEANAEITGKLGDATADLNALRAERITGYVNESFAGKEALITAIYNERFKELAFEGHRFFDLRRRNLNIERLPQDAVNAFGAILLQPSNAQYVFPIPSTEILVNKNMQQNPRYAN